MVAVETDPFFADVQPQGTVRLGDGKSVPLPIRYFDIVTFSGRFAADADAVREALPSSRLVPVELTPGQALVVLMAFDYRRSDIGPYREFAVWIPVSDGGGDKASTRPGLYCHVMPLTSEDGLIAGIEGWGFPKFLADIAIEETGSGGRCHVAADGREILTFEVDAAAPVPTPEPTDIDIYTAKGGEVLRCRVATAWSDGACAGSGRASLRLGDHPRAAALRQLGIAAEAIDRRYEPGRKLLLYGPDHRFPR